jgi:acetyl-CoA C-acetyltransferase
MTLYIVEATRTPVGSFLGSLSGVSAPQLAATCIQSLLTRSGVSPEAIDQGILGCVLSSGIGQAPARQAMIAGGISTQAAALTINKVCGSGMKAVMLAANEIRCGEADLVLAGGMESMSQSPYLVKNARTGFRMGAQEMADSMILDGLWDPYHHIHMGEAAEACATKYHFSREAQDAFAAESYQRARLAMETGAFKREISSVSVSQRKGPATMVQQDEQPFKDDIDKLSSLRPAFVKENGTITAGNASTLNDGAAVLLLASEQAVARHGLKPRAKILGSATFSQEPKWFSTAPVGAIQTLLQKLNLSVSDIDFYEINEAFAVVAMAAITELKLPADKVNARGGAISLGHPIGASGARLLVTLLHTLEDQQKRLGLATLCIGGGEATAMLIERF